MHRYVAKGTTKIKKKKIERYAKNGTTKVCKTQGLLFNSFSMPIWGQQILCGTSGRLVRIDGVLLATTGQFSQNYSAMKHVRMMSK
jgi:hypothetical protein